MGFGRSIVTVAAVLVAVTLLVVAALLFELASWEEIVRVLLLVAGGGLLLMLIFRRAWLTKAGLAIRQTLSSDDSGRSGPRLGPLLVAVIVAPAAGVLAIVATMSIWNLGIEEVAPWLAAIGALVFAVAVLVALGRARLGSGWVKRVRLGYIPVAVVTALLGGVLAVVAIMSIWNLGIDEVAPWLAAIGAVLLLTGSLMAISYAPPGPNWVKKISGLDGQIVLAMVGIAIVLFATLGYFDLGGEDEPTDWWLALAGIGLLLGLIAMRRSPTHRTGAATPPRPAASLARDAAARARTSADGAQVAGERARENLRWLPNDPDRVRAEQQATDAVMAAVDHAKRADEAARQATALQKGLDRKVAAATADAAAAATAAATAEQAESRSRQEVARRLEGDDTS